MNVLLSQVTQFLHQLRAADWLQFSAQILAAGLAAVAAIVGVNLGNKNARKVQQEEAKRQLERDRQSEEVRLTALLEALREELSVSWNAYILQVGQWVENVRDSEHPQPLPFWPCYGEYFAVFRANAAGLGMIKSDELRKALVEAYVLAQGNIDTYQSFNRLRSEYEHISAQDFTPPGTPDSIAAFKRTDRALAAVVDYHPRVIRSHDALKARVKHCCALLDANLGNSSTELFLINKPVPEGSANI
jgi:hypothetical protein